jgi:hypothetical protein
LQYEAERNLLRVEEELQGLIEAAEALVLGGVLE